MRVETREVLLPLNAYDDEGRNVAGLTPKDLIVIEDGERRTITSLRREPANIVLILDSSSEIGTFKNGPTERNVPLGKVSKSVLPPPATRELADNFAAQLAESDHLAIIQYSDKVQVLQDWTEDRAAALASLNSKFKAGVKASYYDALALAAEKLRARTSGRRVIVLVSDGIDSSSHTTREQALAAVTRTRASVFIVSWGELLKREVESARILTDAHRKDGVEIWGDGPQKRARELRGFIPKLEAATAQLRELAEAGGGQMLLPASFDEFVATPKRIIKEVGAQYTLAFLTSRRSGLESRRTVQVLPTRAGLTVRARRSYYADDETPPE